MSNQGQDNVDPSAPAGWYPVDGGQQRYWDGTIWTEHIAPGPGSAGVAPGSGVPTPGQSAFEPAPFTTDPSAAAGVAAVTGDDRNMSVLIHVLSLFTGFIGPLVIWLLKRETSPFIDHHGKEALNFQITMAIGWVIAALATLVLIGLLLMPILLLAQLIVPIIAAVRASSGQWYRYPFTIRLIS